MRKINLVKVIVVTAVFIIGFAGFWLTRKSEMQTVDPVKTAEQIFDGKYEVIGYKNWTKVNDKPEIMFSEVSKLCVRLPREESEKISENPHRDKFINVYVNSVGKDEMLTKKNPKFPVGTVVVKEKLENPDSPSPELLTVMIKRKKGFNPEVGDWEFMTLNGDASEVTSRGKLANCQACHLNYERNDFVTRTYLPRDVWQKLK
jgi:hypothetical protein